MSNRVMWFAAFLLSVTITSIAVQYLWDGAIAPLQVLSIALGAVIGWIFITRIGGDQMKKEPRVDERQRHHVHLSGYWAFLFLNLLIIAALLQPWLSQADAGLWIGVLAAGLIFWAGNLIFLGMRR